jgi:uncharacterized repeat protein (TIGR02059 family)
VRKSIFAILLLLLISAASKATDYYVATNGNDSNPGTITQPWRTWQKGFSTVSAGDVLYIRGGNYTGMYGSGHGVKISSRDGSSSSKITVMAYPGEKPVLDCASLSSSAGVNYGILLSGCDNWVIVGLTVKNVREYNNLSKSSSGAAPTTGWELSNCTKIRLEQCDVTNCGNGFTLNGTVNDIYYVNCDAYYNYDYYDNGGLANGFGGNVRGSSTIFYEGCRAWANSDDGWDNYGGAGYMVYKNCWAFRNGKDTPTIGNGDGFKLGYDASFTDLPNSQRTLYNCISADNYLMGFDEGMDQITSMDMALYNCIAYKNVRDFGFRFYKTDGTARTTLKNNISYGNNVNYQGRSRNTSERNTWDASAPTVSDADFVSTDMTQLGRPRKSDGSLPEIEFAHLKAGSDLIDAGTVAGMAYTGSAPDLGVFETGSTAPAPTTILAYQSSTVKSTNPSDIEILYNLSVSPTLPPLSSFEVKVNSVSKTISKLVANGKNLYITLSTPVKYGETITLSYTKPSTSPLQCTGGTQAESISLKSVTNGVQATPMALVNSVIDNDTPNKIELNFSDLLAGTKPPVTAFTTSVNGKALTVSSVEISEKTVLLTLPANLTNNDTIKVSYTKPSSNQLQSTSGAAVENFVNQPVSNNIGESNGELATDGKLRIVPNPSTDYITIANLKGSGPATIRFFDFAGNLCQEIKVDSLDSSTRIATALKPGFYVTQISIGTVFNFKHKLIVVK